MKILILKPSSLGDVIQALPVLRLLKQHFLESEIHWWIDLKLAPLLQGDPDLYSVIPFDRQHWGWPWHWPEMWRSIQRMRDEAFDWVVDLQSLMRSGIMSWLANGCLTIGLDDSREGARGFYDLIVPRPSFHTHAVDWYLEVLRRMDVPVHGNFTWLPERPKVAATVREKWGAERGRWLVLQPGARWKNKRWPVAHFMELVRLVAEHRSAVTFAILGSISDQELGNQISSVCPKRCLDLTGKTTLLEMIEWIRLGQAIVTNDSGPMHAAAALGKPVVAMFGPTEPRRTGPYGQIERVIQSKLSCVPCLKSSCNHQSPLECLRRISPETVYEHLEPLLPG